MSHPITHSLRTALAGWRARRARDRAVRTALARFGALHAGWYASCFDETFVRRIGIDAVLAGPSVEVARSWTLQFRYAEERARERDVRQLVPVVESFATLLQGALAEMGLTTARGRSGRVTDRPCGEGALAAEGCA
jgi:hypothetical protein